MAYDLTLNALPGSIVSDADMSYLLRVIESEPALSVCETVVVFEAGDDPLAPEQLADGIEDGEYDPKDFEDFCRRSGLPADSASARSTTAYLRSMESVGLFLFKLPASRPEIEAAFEALVSVAKRNNLGLHDPQVGRDVDLAHPPAVPLGRAR